MTVYLVHEDGTRTEYKNVILWTKAYIVYKAGKGTCKIYANKDEYFTAE